MDYLIGRDLKMILLDCEDMLTYINSCFYLPSTRIIIHLEKSQNNLFYFKKMKKMRLFLDKLRQQILSSTCL